ncbi:MAG: GNAT family N-acetyltransferase [Anaerolineae bacterium]
MIPYTTLSDGHVTLRPFQFADLGALYAAIRESLADLKPWMSWAHDDYHERDAHDFIAIARARWNEGGLYGFAITSSKDGSLLGACNLSQVHPQYRFCNLGYWVRSSQRGKGIAAKAAQLAARFAFEKVGLIRVEVVVATENLASLRVAEKIGAQREGVLRNRIVVGQKAYDAVMFSLIPEDLGLKSIVQPAATKGGATQ